jgi:hypothetical protein
MILASFPMQESYNGVDVCVAFVGYRDYCDYGRRLDLINFTADIEELQNKLQSVAASGGGDAAEDVSSGITAANALLAGIPACAVKLIFHVADAPAHGIAFHEAGYSDDHASESPSKLDTQVATAAKNGVSYSFLRINDSTSTMLKRFAEVYHASAVAGAVFKVLEFEHATHASRTGASASLAGGYRGYGLSARGLRVAHADGHTSYSTGLVTSMTEALECHHSVHTSSKTAAAGEETLSKHAATPV